MERWLEQIDKEEVDGMEQLLNAFGIEVYRANSRYPDEALCHFGPLPEEKQ